MLVLFKYNIYIIILHGHMLPDTRYTRVHLFQKELPKIRNQKKYRQLALS